MVTRYMHLVAQVLLATRERHNVNPVIQPDLYEERCREEREWRSVLAETPEHRAAFDAWRRMGQAWRAAREAPRSSA